MIPEVIIKIILALAALFAAHAPHDAPAHPAPPKTLYVYATDDGPKVTDTPIQGMRPLQTLRPTPRAQRGPGAKLPLGRAAPYMEMAIRHARSHGLEPALVLGVIEAESYFNPKAVSRAGAVGMMQLMPVHWPKLKDPSNPYDPDENVRVGCAYLSKLVRTHKGDVHRAIAAYNTGSGNVRKHQGPPTYTLGYVLRIARAQARWSAHLTRAPRTLRPRSPGPLPAVQATGAAP